MVTMSNSLTRVTLRSSMTHWRYRNRFGSTLRVNLRMVKTLAPPRPLSRVDLTQNFTYLMTNMPLQTAMLFRKNSKIYDLLVKSYLSVTKLKVVAVQVEILIVIAEG